MLFFDVEADNYLEDATRIWCIVAYDDELDTWYRFGPDEIEEGVRLVSGHDCRAAHNGFGFDFPLITKLHGVDWREGPGFQGMVDTLVLSRLAFPDLNGVSWVDKDTGKRQFQTHSIEAWGRRLDEPKGSFDEFSKWDPAMLDYCEQDVRVMVALVAKIREEAPWALTERCFGLEHEFARNIQDMMDLGAPYDEELADEILEETQGKMATLFPQFLKMHQGWYKNLVKKKVSGILGRTVTDEECDTLFAADGFKEFRFRKRPEREPFNPNSDVQVRKLFKEKYDWVSPKKTDSGLPSVSWDVLESLSFPEASLLVDWALLSMLASSLSTGEKSWSKNVEDGRIHGFVCHNGTPTSRCRHSGPNLGNIPRRGDWLRCRALFKAKPGNVLVGADASALELVMLAHYLSYWDGGRYVEVMLSGDPHTFNQEAAGLPTRDQAKELIYAHNYGAGDPKLGSLVSKSKDFRVLKREGSKLRARLVKGIPFFEDLVNSVKERANTKGELIGLDGRRIPTRSDHSALNFLLQGGGAVVMKRATNLACRQVSGLVLHVHDEMQFEVPEDRGEEVGVVLAESIRQAGRDMGLRCPLDAAYKVGPSWASTH